MSRSIFISCGQFNDKEKQLGSGIVALVNQIPEMEAYFAEEVQDLTGLESNILTRLHDCDGFITVLHPRGQITRPNAPLLTRASVWIEQEIAVVTYIRQVEKRRIPVIAFKHKSVGLEGIRGLIQLNPLEFSEEAEVLAQLPALLARWKVPSETKLGGKIASSEVTKRQDEHEIRELRFSLINDTHKRISDIAGEIRIPEPLLSHWSAKYGQHNYRSPDGRYRIFRFDEHNVPALQPHSSFPIGSFEYCKQCAIEKSGESGMLGGAIVDEYTVGLKFWAEGREYHFSKTLKQLLIEVDGRQGR